MLSRHSLRVLVVTAVATSFVAPRMDAPGTVVYTGVGAEQDLGAAMAKAFDKSPR